MLEKIKQFFIEGDRGKDVFTVAIVVLVGISSFSLGRLSKANEQAGLKILSNASQIQEGAALSALPEEANTVIQNSVDTNSSVTSHQLPSVSSNVGKAYFASKRGHKYYSVGCSAGKTIKQENRLYFSTKEEAEKKGYSLSSSCK